MLAAFNQWPFETFHGVQGVITKLAEISMSCEDNPDIRLPEASLRALANAINNTTLVQRENLMSTWPWASARPFLTQYSSAVCLHTWELLQNLSNSSDEHPVQQAVLKWSEGGLLPLAHSILAGTPLDARTMHLLFISAEFSPAADSCIEICKTSSRSGFHHTRMAKSLFMNHQHPKPEIFSNFSGLQITLQTRIRGHPRSRRTWHSLRPTHQHQWMLQIRSPLLQQHRCRVSTQGPSNRLCFHPSLHLFLIPRGSQSFASLASQTHSRYCVQKNKRHKVGSSVQVRTSLRTTCSP